MAHQRRWSEGFQPQDLLEDSEDEVDFRRSQLKEKARLLRSQCALNAKSFLSIKNIANAIFILGIFAVCMQQCYYQVLEYFRYSTRIQVSHSLSSFTTLAFLPGVTICNNNRINMEKLIQRVPELEAKLDEYLGSRQGEPINLLRQAERIQAMKAIKKIVEANVNISAILENSAIPSLLDLAKGAMIKDVDCNCLWSKPYNCDNFRIIESYQAGACYTVFYLGALMEAMSSGKAYEFNSSLTGGRRRLEGFDPFVIAELVVDFGPLKHGDFNRDVGGRVIVHSTGHIGSVRDMAYAIKPGRSYDIIIKRYLSKRLPPPYKSQCFDYRGNNSARFMQLDKSEPPFPSVELDRTTCLRNCAARHTIESCKCWPAEVPYYTGDTLLGNISGYRLCAWGSGMSMDNETALLHHECYRRFIAVCRNQCRQGCYTEDYRVNVISRAWPSREKFSEARDETTLSGLRERASCCAKISLKYLEFMENRLVMYPRMNLAQLVSNIGGIVSALVGVSVVTIYRYLTGRVFACRVVNDNVQPASRRKSLPAERARNKI